MPSGAGEDRRPGDSRRGPSPGARTRLGLAAALTAALALAAGCASGGGGSESGDARVLEARAGEQLRENLVTLREVYETVRFDGEFGLMVRDSAGQLRVHWITRETGPGVLDVYAGDSLLHHAETPVHLAHGVSLPRPEASSVRLEYGALEDGEDRHTTTLHLEPDPPPRPAYSGVDSLFAVGDVHGEYENVTDLLYNAGLVNEDLDWYGGRAHVLFLGDLFDRGHDVTKILWYLYGLERQARAAGGRVHVLLGNHETMVMTGDLRYVSPKERMIASFYGTTYPDLFDLRNSVLGRWLASLQGMVEIDGHLFVHGGVTPEYAHYGVGEFNDSLSAFMDEELFRNWSDTTYVPQMDSATYTRRYDFFFGDRSPFWYRGYVTSEATDSVLAGVLERYGLETMVVAHTTVEPIQSLHGGKLIAVDLDDPATEMLFLERTDDGFRRLRFELRGGPGPLPEGPVSPGRRPRPDG